jgi:tight adherence protein B
MTGGLSRVLVAASFLSLIGFGFSGLLVSQAQARRAKRDARIHEAVRPFRKVRFTELRAFHPAPGKDKSLVEIAASIFSFNLERVDQYPVPWWSVLIASLVLARVQAGFVVDIVGPLGLISVPVLWIVMCRLFFGWAVGRRKIALIRQFPDALDMIVRSVRVGIPVLGATLTVARESQPPTSIEFTRLGNELSVGVPLDKAVTDMGIRNDLPEYRFFATAITLQTQTGGALSQTLENLADLIRKRIALQERGHALSSEARTSALILGCLPIVMGSGLWLLNPSYMSLLFNTGTGHVILGVAVLALTLGGVTMKVIIAKSLS